MKSAEALCCVSTLLLYLGTGRLFCADSESQTKVQQKNPSPHEGYLPVTNALLYYRDIGQGEPIIVIHGGPDFDHNYLLPDLDRLADTFRLIYYDQRGRGKSAGDVRPEDVSIESEMEDLDSLREHFHLNTVSVMGHSWGGLLAMEYAIRYPEHVSHLILLNTGPASHEDYLLMRQGVSRLRTPAEVARMKEISASKSFQEGDPKIVSDYYRIHFRPVVREPQVLSRLLQNLLADFTNATILKARAVETQLMKETWANQAFDLFPQLNKLHTPTLVIHGEYDFIPIDCATHIARTIPGARFVVLKQSGHFSCIDHPEEVRAQLVEFFGRR